MSDLMLLFLNPDQTRWPSTQIISLKDRQICGNPAEFCFGDSAALGIRSSGRDACAGDTSRASAGRIALERVLRLVPPTLSIRFDEHVATNFAQCLLNPIFHLVSGRLIEVW